MGWANLPVLATEKIIFYAVKEEHKKQELEYALATWEDYPNAVDHTIDRWIQLLRNYGQVCPQWKNVILESKLLTSHKKKQIFMHVMCYDSDDSWERAFSFVREGYMKIATEMLVWFGFDTVQKLQVRTL